MGKKEKICHPIHYHIRPVFCAILVSQVKLAPTKISFMIIRNYNIQSKMSETFSCINKCSTSC